MTPPSAPRTRTALALLPAAALWLGCAHTTPHSPASALRSTAQRDGAEHRPSAAEFLAQADRMRDSGQRGQAALEYFRAMRAEPESAAPRERIGYLQIARDPERAAGIFEGLLSADPKRSIAQLGEGLSQLQRGNYAAARRSLERALELAPQSLDTLVALAVTCDWSGDAPAADRYYARALELDPSNADVHGNRGMTQLLRGRYAEAAASLRQALRSRPGDPGLTNNLGLALGRGGDSAGALAAFRAVGPEASALNNLGYVYYLNGQPERAIEQYERALALRPEHPLPILQNLRDAELRIAERGVAATAPSPAETPLAETPLVAAAPAAAEIPGASRPSEARATQAAGEIPVATAPSPAAAETPAPAAPAAASPSAAESPAAALLSAATEPLAPQTSLPAESR